MQVLVAYWALTLPAGLLLPQGDRLVTLEALARRVVGPLAGVVEVASRSFDPAFAISFHAVSLLCALMLAIASLYWIPSGSQKTFRDAKSKFAGCAVAVLVMLLSLGVTVNTHASQGLGEGRTAALLFLGASTKIGVLTLLNAWFGFAQLFIFVILRAVITTPIRREP